MADSLINKLAESTSLKAGDFTVFDISAEGGGYDTKKVSYDTIYTGISSVVNSGLQAKLDTLQSNINLANAEIAKKLDKRGLLFNSNEKVTGTLVLNSVLSALDLSYFNSIVNLNNNRIINVATCISSTDAANKAYVDTKVASISVPDTSGFVLKSGSTMTGSFILAGNPSVANEAVNLAYLNSTLGSITNGYLPISGGTMTGDLNFGGAVIIKGLPILNETTSSPNDGANKEYVDRFKPTGKYLPLSGGTMTGNIIVPTGKKITITDTPTVTTDAANKAYVDSINPAGSYLPLAGGTMTGDVNLNNRKITNVPNPASITEPVTLGYGDLRYLKLAGGDLTGNLGLHNFYEDIVTATIAAGVLQIDLTAGNTFWISLPSGTVITGVNIIGASSTPNKGTTFTIFMEQPASGEQPASAATISSWGSSILWVGTPAVLSSTLGKTDVFSFTKHGKGSINQNKWFGFTGNIGY